MKQKRSNNFLDENFLSQFLKINQRRKSRNLWTGIVEYNNIKNKENIFKIYHILNCLRYIGRIKNKISLPRFYLYLIQRS